MKRLLLILILPVLFSCVVDPPLEPETEADYEALIADLQAQIDALETLNAENEEPIVAISPEGQTVTNGARATFTANVKDADDVEFIYVWAVDGIVKSETDTMSFSATPEFQKEYTVALSVSDGNNLVSTSTKLTVLKPVWTPTALHIYIFEVGAELDDSTIVKDYIADSAEAYPALLKSVKLRCEVLNQTGNYYIVEGGV